MTFAQLLHKVLDHFFGDEAFARRERRQIEKISDRLWDEVYEEVFDEAFTAGVDGCPGGNPTETAGRLQGKGPPAHPGQTTGDER